MKYSERFFNFPIRIYDRYTSNKAAERETIEQEPSEGEWASGWLRIPYQHIDGWSDYFDSTQGVEGVKEDGFQYTVVWTKDVDMYICIWDKKKFEDKLNEYVANYEEAVRETINKAVAKGQAVISIERE